MMLNIRGMMRISEILTTVISKIITDEDVQVMYTQKREKWHKKLPI